MSKAARINRESKRAKLMKCGHGSRHRSKYDNGCKRCWAAGKYVPAEIA